MENIVNSVTIENVTYTEFYFVEDGSSPAKVQKLSLDILLLNKDVNQQTLLTNYIDDHPLYRYDIVRIRFDFDIEYNNTLFELKLNIIEDLNEVKKLFVENYNVDSKVIIIGNLNKTETSDIIAKMNRLRFKGCQFKSGFDLHNKKEIVVELFDCDIYDANSIYCDETKNTTFYAFLERCNFYSLRKIFVNNITQLYITDCELKTVYSSSATIKSIGEITSPFCTFKNIDVCNITNFNVIQLVSGFEFINIYKLNIYNFSGNLLSLNKGDRLDNVIYISKCTHAAVTNSTIWGILVSECEEAIVSCITILNTMIANTSYIVNISKCNNASISNIVYEKNTAITGIKISNCSNKQGNITICDCTFDNLNGTIKLLNNNCSINIIDCLFKYNTNCPAIDIGNIYSVSVIDCIFLKNTINIQCKTVSDLYIDNCSFDNITQSVTDDIDIQNISNILKIDESEFKSNKISLSFISELDIESSSFNMCQTYLNSIRKCNMNNTVINNNIFNTNLIENMNLDTVVFDGLKPEIKFGDYIDFDSCEFGKGVVLENTGDSISSIVKNCIFKDTVILNDCDNIEFTKSNIYNFTSDDNRKIFVVNMCSFIIIDTSSFISNIENPVIEVIENKDKYNNNHFIVNGSSNQKVIVSGSSNNYEYVKKVLLNWIEPKSLQLQTKFYDSINTIMDVFNLKLNTISVIYSDFKYTDYYVSTLNNHLKKVRKQL